MIESLEFHARSLRANRNEIGRGTRKPLTLETRVSNVAVTYQWRGAFTNAEVNTLHAEAFETQVYDESEWDWLSQVRGHSLGWVVARDEVDNSLLAFVNVPWDGLVHAWIQDTMVAGRARRRGIGKRVVEIALRRPGGPAANGCTLTSRTICALSTSTPAGSSQRTQA
jgi:hypothetical protein